MARNKKPEAPVEPPASDQPPVSFSGLTDEFGAPTFKIEEDKPAPGYNAADEKQVENARREAGQWRRFERDFWHVAMSTPQRRATLYRLLEAAHIWTEPADLGTQSQGSDPLRTYHNLGRQSLGKQIMLAAMDASLDLYLQMIREHKEAEDARARKSEGKST